MKIFKFYENIEDELTVGDYILMKIDIHNSMLKYDKIIEHFINNTIGEVFRFNIDKGVIVSYENVPNDIKSYFSNKNDLYFRNFDIDRIVEYGKTIEELKMKLETKKFNI